MKISTQDVQGRWTAIHCSRWTRSSTLGLGWYSRVTEVGTKRLIHGLVKLTQFAWALLLCGDETSAFKDRKAFSFSIGLCSDPHLWSWILGDDWKNTLKRTDGRDGIFAKRPWCDTSWQRAQVWNMWSPECQATSPYREIPAMLVRPCIQKGPGKNGELSPSGYSLHPLGSGTHGVTTSPTLLCPVLAWNQQNNLKLLLIVRCFGPS